MFSSSSVAACGGHSNIRLPERTGKGRELHPPEVHHREGEWLFPTFGQKQTLKILTDMLCRTLEWDSRPCTIAAPLMASKECLRLEKISRIAESNLCPVTTLSPRPEHRVPHPVVPRAPPGMVNAGHWTRPFVYLCLSFPVYKVGLTSFVKQFKSKFKLAVLYFLETFTLCKPSQ